MPQIPDTPVANVYDAATNRSGVNASTPDAAGRRQSIGGYGFTYDGENRMIGSALDSTAVYQDNGAGRSVEKIICPSVMSTCTAATPGASTVWYDYGAAGKLSAEHGHGAMASALPCTACISDAGSSGQHASDDG